MNKRQRNKKEKNMLTRLNVNRSLLRPYKCEFTGSVNGIDVGKTEYTSKRKINCIYPEVESITSEQAEELREKLQIIFDKSGKDHASYVSECGWRFEFIKPPTEKGE